MELSYTPEDLAFRREVREWLQANLPDDLRRKVDEYATFDRPDIVRWQKILAAKGWGAPSWPVEWGGQDWSIVQRYLFEEECALAGVPPRPHLGLTLCASVLIAYGTPAQKERFLPRIYHADELWCQGYSEPGAGSDLASLKTRAVRDGDHYVVNGQKIWTTYAHYSDWMFCLVRTNTEVARRQEGISFLLIDMNTPGITVRPLPLFDREREVNEVFLDNVRVPVENLVHEEGQGWNVAKHLLSHERLNTGRIGQSKRELLRLKQLARNTRTPNGNLLADPRFRDRISRLEVELMALELTNLRFVDQMQRTGELGPDISLLKIRGTEIQQQLTELMMSAVGPAARREDVTDPFEDTDRLYSVLAARYFNFRKASIYSGANEIQRNIIARSVLGM